MSEKIEYFEINSKKELEEENIIKIIDFFKKTFKRIENLYSNDEGFFLDKMDLKDKKNIFYQIKNNNGEILVGMWITKTEENDNAKYYIRYTGVGERYQGKGLGTKIKQTLENAVIEETNKTGKSAIIMSRVKKGNIKSQKWNKKLGYKKHDEGENSDFFQYYKDIIPNN